MVAVISRNEDIAAHDRQQSRVVGRYTQIDVRMNQHPPPRYTGHVAIELDDGTQVLLYPVWDPQAQREDVEITRFEGKRIEVTGKLYTRAPENRDGNANLRIPCIKDLTDIRLSGNDKAT